MVGVGEAWVGWNSPLLESWGLLMGSERCYLAITFSEVWISLWFSSVAWILFSSAKEGVIQGFVADFDVGVPVYLFRHQLETSLLTSQNQLPDTETIELTFSSHCEFWNWRYCSEVVSCHLGHHPILPSTNCLPPHLFSLCYLMPHIQQQLPGTVSRQRCRKPPMM